MTGVRTGLDRVADGDSKAVQLIAGRNIGLLAHAASVDRALRPAATVLRKAGARISALFGPEHGFGGAAQDMVGVDSDDGPEVPVYSLYGDDAADLSPNPEWLRDLDAVVIDLQDVGSRYYTYVWTAALTMKAAASVGTDIVVLDRPDPIGGVAVQGSVLDPEFATFVGMFPVPMRHGMTPGELARLMVGEFGVHASLTVIPVDGWRRDMPFSQTGLPWVAPSPNMPDTVSALHYAGTCLFEGTNLSVGRGTDRPFQQVGAPWIDGVALADVLNDLGLPGVRFEAVTFTPDDPGDGKFPGTTVQGVRFVALDDTYDPTHAAVATLEAARLLSGERWEWRVSHFDRLAGTDELRRSLDAGWTWDRAVAPWAEPLQAFRALRTPYLIYP